MHAQTVSIQYSSVDALHEVSIKYPPQYQPLSKCTHTLSKCAHTLAKFTVQCPDYPSFSPIKNVPRLKSLAYIFPTSFCVVSCAVFYHFPAILMAFPASFFVVSCAFLELFPAHF